MFTLSQLDAIEAAIVSGVRTVSYDGKSVTYSSLDDMLRLRTVIRIALGLSPTKSATIRIAHDRGQF